MKVDAHHHLWDPAVRDYPWMTGEAVTLARRFDLADLRRELATTPIDATVLVQTVSDVAETREFLATAARSAGAIAGVVGWVDLTAGSVGDTLAELVSSEFGRALVGVRHQVHDEDMPAWLLRDDVHRGLRAVRDAGLVFDLLVRTRELPVAISTVQLLPELRFVLDHLAKPPIRARQSQPWATLVGELARFENVSCKLSGLLTEAPAGVTSADLAPYVDRVLEVFGAGRVLYGSDWPISTLRTTYRGAYDLATELTSVLSDTERDAVFGDNAVRTYGLANERSSA
jgi:L-fuconolactonase